MKAMRTFTAAATLVTLIAAPGLSAQDTGATEIYSGCQYQFVIDLPSGWSGYNQNRALGRAMRFGMIVFSEGKIDPVERAGQGSELAKADTGQKPSFFVDRGPAGKGMSCAGFSKGAAKDVDRRLRSGPMFGRDRKVIRDLTPEEVTIGDCRALRFRAETQAPDGQLSAMDVHALSDGKTLYLFALRNPKQFFDRNLPVYEASMKTVRLAASGAARAETPDCAAAASGWKVANDQNVGDERIVEYVPEGQRAGDWSRILTVQSVAGLKLSLNDMMEHQKKGLADVCKQVEFKVLAESDTSLLYERHCMGCGKSPDEHEVSRFIRGATAVHRVAVLKREDWSETDKQKWASLLAEIQIQPAGGRASAEK